MLYRRLLNKSLDIIYDLRSWASASHLPTQSSQRDHFESWYERSWNLDQARRAEFSQWIRRCLRRYPYWTRGHLVLARFSLDLSDIATAYASLQAVGVLDSGQQHKLVREHLLARCYLSSGAAGKARDILQSLSHERRIPAISEDLAAAQMALGEMKEAQVILEGISADEISQEGKTALTYLRGKANG